MHFRAVDEFEEHSLHTSGTMRIEDKNGVFLPETRLFLPYLQMADTNEETFAKKLEGTAVSCQQKKRLTCAPLPSSCLAVFVDIAGDNGVRYSSTIDLVMVINHTDRFEQVFAHARAYTTARPHDRTTTASFRGVSHERRRVFP